MGTKRADRPQAGNRHGTQDASRHAATEDMLRRLAHELRAPIAAIISGADVIRKAGLGHKDIEDYRAYADQIHDSASHALAVISRAIESITEADEQTTLVQLDLCQAIGACAGLLEPMATDADVRINVDCPAQPCLVVTDPVALDQMIVNIAGNALKFTPPGGEVVLSCSSINETAELLVRDNGIGMGPAELRRIMAEADSPGLGYRIVRALAKRCRAEVVVTSRRGHGTHVAIRFPTQTDAGGPAD